MTLWGSNHELSAKRRFPASSFEFRLFLYDRQFRFDHPPMAYMKARAKIRVIGSRPYTLCRRLRQIRVLNPPGGNSHQKMPILPV